MVRFAHYLTLAAGAAVLFVQPVSAQPQSAHLHRARHAAYAYSHLSVPAASPQELANPMFYGPFGGYADASAASRYFGRNQRRYFGYGGPDQPVGFGPGTDQHAALDGLVAQAASANSVPVSLVQRVIMRESRYNPRAVNGGNYGLMQIRLGTARAMGYSGSAAGLLDAETNMTYAVRYLAGAYRAAGANETRALALYARGY
jgi:soluble lytic murein transglycosylase-like protein